MFDQIFEEKYSKLNKAQKEAVDNIEGPVLVVAGPGTGKTTILTLRIAQILRQTDTPADGILAITYTDAGVKAMRQKLTEIIGNRAHDVCIYTFHSFASAMISEYPDHFLEFGDFKQMTDIDQESIVRKIIEEPFLSLLRPLGRPDAYLPFIVRGISDCKKDDQSPESVRVYVQTEIERVKSDEENISTRGISKGKLKAEALEKIEKLEKTLLFADVYEKYEVEKDTLKLRDYDDLIMKFLFVLRKDNLLLRLVQERFLYLLVDEHQDTNDSQNFIVSLIAEFFENPNIFIVGDEKQAIYRFQGASVENFLKLQKKWPSMKVINLDTNYRSHQSMLDATFAMIENNYADGEYSDLRVKLKSGGGQKGEPLDIIVGENSSSIEQYLVDRLKDISNKEPNSTVAVITRRNRELERVIRLLESNNISVSSERSVDIFHHPIGSLFFDLIEFIVDPTRIDCLSRTIVSGMWSVSFGQSVEIIRDFRSGKLSDLGQKLPAISSIQKAMLEDTAIEALIEVAEQSGFTSLVFRQPSFVHIWRGIVTLAQSLSRDGNIQNPTELFKSMLSYRLSAESKTVKVSVGAPDCQIMAMTAHGSKGLEFDYVFIPYANEEAWVGRSRGSSFVLPVNNSVESDVRDIRRLFYVAITRARRHATVLYSLQESDGKVLTPLRFIDELHKQNILNKKLERVDITTFNTNNNSKNTSQSLLENYTKEVLLDSGLSVTALNHFLECPNKFLYESILKLPQKPSVSAEKGSAMHLGLSRVWSFVKQNSESKSEPINPEKIEKIISDSLIEYIDKSLLSSVDKIALKKEILADLPAISKALTDHFIVSGLVSAEKWVEVAFEAIHNKTEIIIPLHGKIDAIIDSGEILSVFDYKTRQSMSISAIKGQTKNDDGSYFRQLIFYTLLLKNTSKWKLRQVSTSLVFVLPDEKGRCPTVTISVDDADIKKVEQEIQSLVDSVWSGEIFTKNCLDPECKYCGYRKLLG